MKNFEVFSWIFLMMAIEQRVNVVIRVQLPVSAFSSWVYTWRKALEEK